MRIREPVVAGQFYPADPEQCRKELDRLLGGMSGETAQTPRPVGGIVPHAGWRYSGPTAAKVFRRLASRRPVAVVVLFGGFHSGTTRHAALFTDGRWETPIGPMEIDGRLGERVLGQTNLIRDDLFAHENEHSLEVQMPFIKYCFPEARILPIMVSPSPEADEIGEAVGRTLSTYGYEALIVGTTDLTHYGPGYGFIPRGIGPQAAAWAKNENDRKFLELTCALRASEVVGEAMRRQNACSAGAVAATLGAVKTLGATQGVLVEHTTSAEVAAGRSGSGIQDSVGYAGIIFC